MSRFGKAPLLAMLLYGCVQRVDLGVPVPPEDAGVEPDLGGPDLGEPDETPPPLPCGELDRAPCDERVDCDWYGGDAGFCAAAGPCDDHLLHGDCVTDAECDWTGEGDGFCVPTEGDSAPCSDLTLLHCEETPGCVWEGGEFGECYGGPEPRECAGLTMEVCQTRDRCRWYGELSGFCDQASPCAEVVDYEQCITRSSCDWRGGLDGFCGPAEGDPGGCAELTQLACDMTDGCLWDGVPGECAGGPLLPPGCEGLTQDFCRENPLCDWYGPLPPDDGGLCDPVGVCDELSSHGACVLRSACDWEGEDAGFCRPALLDPGNCSGFGFFDCSRDDRCVWEGGDFGECFDL